MRSSLMVRIITRASVTVLGVYDDDDVLVWTSNAITVAVSAPLRRCAPAAALRSAHGKQITGGRSENNFKSYKHR